MILNVNGKKIEPTEVVFQQYDDKGESLSWRVSKSAFTEDITQAFCYISARFPNSRYDQFNTVANDDPEDSDKIIYTIVVDSSLTSYAGVVIYQLSWQFSTGALISTETAEILIKESIDGSGFVKKCFPNLIIDINKKGVALDYKDGELILLAKGNVPISKVKFDVSGSKTYKRQVSDTDWVPLEDSTYQITVPLEDHGILHPHFVEILRTVDGKEENSIASFTVDEEGTVQIIVDFKVNCKIYIKE